MHGHDFALCLFYIYGICSCDAGVWHTYDNIIYAFNTSVSKVLAANYCWGTNLLARGPHNIALGSGLEICTGCFLLNIYQGLPGAQCIYAVHLVYFYNTLFIQFSAATVRDIVCTKCPLVLWPCHLLSYDVKQVKMHCIYVCAILLLSC